MSSTGNDFSSNSNHFQHYSDSLFTSSNIDQQHLRQHFQARHGQALLQQQPGPFDPPMTSNSSPTPNCFSPDNLTNTYSQSTPEKSSMSHSPPSPADSGVVTDSKSEGGNVSQESLQNLDQNKLEDSLEFYRSTKSPVTGLSFGASLSSEHENAFTFQVEAPSHHLNSGKFSSDLGLATSNDIENSVAMPPNLASIWSLPTTIHQEPPSNNSMEDAVLQALQQQQLGNWSGSMSGAPPGLASSALLQKQLQQNTAAAQLQAMQQLVLRRSQSTAMTQGNLFNRSTSYQAGLMGGAGGLNGAKSPLNKPPSYSTWNNVQGPTSRSATLFNSLQHSAGSLRKSTLSSQLAAPPRLNRSISTPAKYAYSGLPMSSSGLPMSGAGLPMSGSGLPMSGSGLPMSGSGLPMSGSGLPMSGSGLPMSGSGLPMSGSGLPMSGSGLPLPGSGLPMSGSGLPTSLDENPFFKMSDGGNGLRPLTDNSDNIGFSNFESQLYDIMRSNDSQAFGTLSRNAGKWPDLGSDLLFDDFAAASMLGEFPRDRFSRKVFVGGLPPDIDEDEIQASFRQFGPLVVDWPHKAESKSYFPPKGYAFLLFQEEMSVQNLLSRCLRDADKLYYRVSSPTIAEKPVQIRPWNLADSDYVLDGSQPLDPRKTIFVGGVPRPLRAIELAMIMDRLYGGVCYAGIDVDPDLKYPKGAGRVAFSNQQSYIAAISARFVQLQHGDIDKRVEVKPYVLDDQHCDECQGSRCAGKFAPFFCANVTCLQYYCEHCWAVIHARPGREFHKPLVKEGADRASRALNYRW